ncbi:uncharacterized protein LOC142529606 [Primulina tabacum]|uniref:uncharacterized protein LOC142529606 n=1 Tax=Primulina tabacum TaxID=48773 RepID=UPI003F5AB0CB
MFHSYSCFVRLNMNVWSFVECCGKMDMKRRNLLLVLMVQQLLFRNLLMLCLLIQPRTRMVANRRHVTRNRPVLYSMTQRINAQFSHLNMIIDAGDVQCVLNLRMNRNAFARLCYLLMHLGGQTYSRYVRVQEKVAMFLSILAHHKKNRVTSHDYMRSGQTVSAHFHEVMHALLKLYTLLLVKHTPVDANCDSDPWKWFKGCLGALDGTHIGVHVRARDKAKYRTRKGNIAVNVLGVCDRNMNFIYALAGWEGYAADARVLRDALTRDDAFKVPRDE